MKTHKYMSITWFVSHSFHVICFTFYHVVSGGEEKRLQHQLPPSSFLARAYYGTRFTPSTTNQSFSTSLGSHVWHNVWLFFVFIKQIAWCHKFGGVDIFWACKPRGCEWLLRSSSLPLKESSNSSGSVTSLAASKNVILSFCDISLQYNTIADKCSVCDTDREANLRLANGTSYPNGCIKKAETIHFGPWTTYPQGNSSYCKAATSTSWKEPTAG